MVAVSLAASVMVVRMTDGSPGFLRGGALFFLCFCPIGVCAVARLIMECVRALSPLALPLLLFGHNSIFSLIFVAFGLRDRKKNGRLGVSLVVVPSLVCRQKPAHEAPVFLSKPSLRLALELGERIRHRAVHHAATTAAAIAATTAVALATAGRTVAALGAASPERRAARPCRSGAWSRPRACAPRPLPAPSRARSGPRAPRREDPDELLGQRRDVDQASWCTPMSTNAPKFATLVTTPSSTMPGYRSFSVSTPS